MSVFPLAWHRQCLANAKANLARQKEALDREHANYNRSAESVAATEAQIAEAEARGLDAFDPEKFGKKRRAG